MNIFSIGDLQKALPNVTVSSEVDGTHLTTCSTPNPILESLSKLKVLILSIVFLDALWV